MTLARDCVGNSHSPRYAAHLVIGPREGRTRRLRASHALIAAIGRQAQELPFHRIDPRDIGRNEVIAAAFTGHHPEVTARVPCGGAGTAEMDKGGQILFLLRAWPRLARAAENLSHVAVEIDGCQL